MIPPADLGQAQRTLKNMGRMVARNAPGPRELGQGAREIFWGPIGVIWLGIGFLLVFGEPIMRWLTR